jgi:hypothetical protein
MAERVPSVAVGNPEVEVRMQGRGTVGIGSPTAKVLAGEVPMTTELCARLVKPPDADTDADLRVGQGSIVRVVLDAAVSVNDNGRLVLLPHALREAS